MKALYILQVIFLLTSFSVVGQQTNSVLPPSPNAASLGKFADNPVSLYTGTPEISIPIFNIEDFGLSIPITLNYHAGGIKVDEVSSWIGLGWNLDAGGVITRVVRGLPDDDPNGFLNVGPITTSPNPGAVFTEEISNYAYGHIDSEPDMFYFNVAGKTGKFFMDKSGKVHIIPHQNIKIESDQYFNYWTLTTEKGIIYKFSEIEVTEVPISQCNPKSSSYVSSWYLKEVTSPVNLQNKITFTYQDQNIIQNLQTSATAYNSNLMTDIPACNYQMFIKSKRLSRINTNLGFVEFISEAAQRSDLSGDFGLKKIVIKNLKEKVIKEYSLKHSYLNQRFMLDEVLESNGADKKQPYKFDYYGGLPSPFSNMQDHWGYYNGKSSNTSLIPSAISPNAPIMLSGADRSVSFEHAKSGTLNKIIYPTGGYTEFQFASNETAFPVTIEHQYVSVSYNLDVRSVQPTTSFTINSSLPQTEVNIIPYHTCEDGTPYAYFEINRTGGGVGVAIYPNEFASGRFTAMLSNGDYTISYYMLDPSIPGRCDGHGVFVEFKEPQLKKDYKAGGLRIAKVSNFDKNNSLISTKRYTYNTMINGTLISSGEVINMPHYNSNFYLEHVIAGGNYRYDVILSRTASPNYPLGTTHGSHIGYKEVVEESENQNGLNNGKSIYKYKMAGEGVNSAQFNQTGVHNTTPDGSFFPFPPVDNYDWVGGYLLDKSDYKRLVNGSFKIVQKLENNYLNYYADDLNCVGDITNNNCNQVLGLKAGIQGRNFNTPFFRFAYYKISTGYNELISEKESVYNYLNEGTPSEVANLTEKTTSYEYNKAHLLPIKITKTSSDLREKTVEFINYPFDYPSGTPFINNLKAKNIYTTPIESVITKQKNSSNNISIVSGEIFKYNVSGNGLIDDTWSLETLNPIPLPSFKFSNKATGILPNSGEKSIFLPDVSYKRLDSYKYDSKGNIIERKKENGIITTYLWGYNSTYPVAEINNGSYLEVVTVLGQNVIDLLTLPNSGTDNQVREMLQPLRTDIRLKNAFVTVNTYDAITGLTSTTNPQGQTTYFDYDSFQRLQRIKDHKGNILKSFDYNYYKP